MLNNGSILNKHNLYNGTPLKEINQPPSEQASWKCVAFPLVSVFRVMPGSI